MSLETYGPGSTPRQSMLAFVMGKKCHWYKFFVEYVSYPTSTPFSQLKVKINVLMI
jgi:hypothetical protein